MFSVFYNVFFFDPFRTRTSTVRGLGNPNLASVGAEALPVSAQRDSRFSVNKARFLRRHTSQRSLLVYDNRNLFAVAAIEEVTIQHV